MAPTLQELGLDRLSPEDRLAVAEAIWDSVASETASLSEGQRAELERRLVTALKERLRAAAALQPRDEWERGLLAAARDCGVSLSDSALSSDGLYD